MLIVLERANCKIKHFTEREFSGIFSLAGGILRFQNGISRWPWNWPHHARPPGIPVREFPGIADPKIPGGNSREFLKFWRELRGIYRNFVSFPSFIVDYDILVFNLTHCIMCTTHDRLTAFWAKPWIVFNPTFCVYRVPVYFQILISKNHWTASEFCKLRSLHEWGRWDNSIIGQKKVLPSPAWDGSGRCSKGRQAVSGGRLSTGRGRVDTTVIDRCRSVSTCGTDGKLLVTLGVDFKT